MTKRERLRDQINGTDITDRLDWLVWSNEHGAWWKPYGWGYTRELSEAGRYTKERADLICQQANYNRINEVAILHPDQISLIVAQIPK